MVGLGFLALAMIGAVMLISDFVFSTTLTIVAGIAAGLVFGLLWAAIPVMRRASHGGG